MFDFYQTYFDEDGELDDDVIQDYNENLYEIFAASPEAAEVEKQYGGVGWGCTQDVIRSTR